MVVNPQANIIQSNLPVLYQNLIGFILAGDHRSGLATAGITKDSWGDIVKYGINYSVINLRDLIAFDKAFILGITVTHFCY